jgi:PAS domain S-box-containing protein
MPPEDMAAGNDEERFRHLATLSSDWYWEQDENFRFTFISVEMGRKSGVEGVTHIGRTRWDMPALNLTAEDWARHRAVLERHEPFRDFVIQRPERDGREHWVSVSADPIFDAGGRFRGYRGIGRDITAQMVLERSLRAANERLEQRVRERTAALEAALGELEAFSYSVSHDLRATLGVICTFSRMVVEDEGPRLSAEGRRQLGVVERNAVRMGELVDDLLSLARLSRSQLKRAPLNVEQMARAIAADLHPRYPAAEFAVGPLPAMAGDATMVRQLLVNLLDNAFKYSSKSEMPRVEIGWAAVEREYFVRDNGVGFDMVYADRLFRPFERLHAEAEFGGTGIGLAIVKRVVERHGGRVRAQSVPGRGTTLWFTLEDAAPAA